MTGFLAIFYSEAPPFENLSSLALIDGAHP
jgi:hypothetical protein